MWCLLAISRTVGEGRWMWIVMRGMRYFGWDGLEISLRRVCSQVIPERVISLHLSLPFPETQLNNQLKALRNKVGNPMSLTSDPSLTAWCRLNPSEPAVLTCKMELVILLTTCGVVRMSSCDNL